MLPVFQAAEDDEPSLVQSEQYQKAVQLVAEMEAKITLPNQ
jgi:hypothetical protein